MPIHHPHHPERGAGEVLRIKRNPQKGDEVGEFITGKLIGQFKNAAKRVVRHH